MRLEDTIDRLYALPLEEFTQERNKAERELRKAGEREQADQVKALRKPTAAAASVNSLVRRNRRQVESFLRAAAKLRDAQFAGKGDLATAAQAEREELEKLVAVGGEPVRLTLQAAAVDDNAARELLEARLVRELEPAGFGTLLAHVEPAGRKGAAEPRGKAKSSKPVDLTARRRLQEAERTLAEAKAEEREARGRVTRAQRELEKAEASVARAQEAVDRLRAG